MERQHLRGGRRAALLTLYVVVLALIVSCGVAAEQPAAVTIPGGDAERGRLALSEWGCGSCHTIPGVTRADALVGPPLVAWSERGYIAGRLDNNPENLVKWIMDPQEVDPGNAMPDVGVPEAIARDIAAYLFTLRRAGAFAR